MKAWYKQQFVSDSRSRQKDLLKITAVIERGDRNNHPDIWPLGLSGDQN